MNEITGAKPIDSLKPCPEKTSSYQNKPLSHSETSKTGVASTRRDLRGQRPRFEVSLLGYVLRIYRAKNNPIISNLSSKTSRTLLTVSDSLTQPEFSFAREDKLGVKSFTLSELLVNGASVDRVLDEHRIHKFTAKVKS